jgi:hypothetical protein
MIHTTKCFNSSFPVLFCSIISTHTHNKYNNDDINDVDVSKIHNKKEHNLRKKENEEEEASKQQERKHFLNTTTTTITAAQNNYLKQNIGE